MDAVNTQLLNSNDDEISDTREYDDVLVVPPDAAAGRYAVISVDRIQSDDVYQALFLPDSREPVVAPSTKNGFERNSRDTDRGMAETLPFPGADQVVKEIQGLKGTTRIQCTLMVFLVVTGTTVIVTWKATYHVTSNDRVLLYTVNYGLCFHILWTIPSIVTIQATLFIRICKHFSIWEQS